MGKFATYSVLCFVEARPVVQVVCLLRFTAGAVLGAPPGAADPARFAVGALGWFLATVAVYVFNGVADRHEDVVNGSRRPIARGDLPSGFAAGAAAACAAASMLCALPMSGRQIALTVAYLAVGYAYSGAPFRLKRGWATTMPVVAVMGLATYLAGAGAGGRGSGAALVVFAAGNAAWMTLVGGISKDLSDVPGDRAAGRRSWPIVFGEDVARLLLAGAAGLVALGFGAAVTLSTPNLTWCALAVAGGAAAVALAQVNAPHAGGHGEHSDAPAGEAAHARAGGPGGDSGCDRVRQRLPYRAFMWTQYLSNLIAVAVAGFRV